MLHIYSLFFPITFLHICILPLFHIVIPFDSPLFSALSFLPGWVRQSASSAEPVLVAPLVLNHLYSLGQQLMENEVKLYESSESTCATKMHSH